MAKDETTQSHMLEKLSETRLPAVSEPKETAAPVDRSRDTREERGRKPEDVVTQQERKAPTTVEKYNVRTGRTDKGDPIHEELTLDEIGKRGLMNSLIQSANQLPSLSQKYQDALEKLAAKDVTQVEKPRTPTEEEKRHEHQQVTLKIMQHMAPATAQEIDFYVKAGLMEPDMAESYPKAVNSFVSISLFHLDCIQELNTLMNAVKEWIKAEVTVKKSNEQKESAKELKSSLDIMLDKLAAKADGEDGELYQGLKDPERRKAYVEWLTNEVDPKQTAITEANLERFWMAFNVPELKNFAKDVAEKAKVPTPRPKAGGDGKSAAAGGKDVQETRSLLERMSDTRLGSEA